LRVKNHILNHCLLFWRGQKKRKAQEEKMSAIRSRKREQWVSAANLLVYKSAQHVGCPECGTPSLQVRDVEYGWGQRRGLERYLVCSHCRAYNAVNMRRAGPLAEAPLLAAE
jgi:hypothetical protein